jgi:hypothetical protein
MPESLKPSEFEAMKRAFANTPIGMAHDIATFEEGWKAARRYLFEEEQEVWTCMSCGIVGESQSCFECGSEAQPGYWLRVENV